MTALSRQNEDLKKETTSKLVAELYISGKPPPEFPGLHVVVRYGEVLLNKDC